MAEVTELNQTLTRVSLLTQLRWSDKKKLLSGVGSIFMQG